MVGNIQRTAGLHGDADAMDDLPDDENGIILRRISDCGDDLAIAREVDFSLLFPTDAAAETFQAQARLLGFRCLVAEIEPQDGLSWDVTASIEMTPSHVGITDRERQLADLAEPLGGVSDGWGFMGTQPQS